MQGGFSVHRDSLTSQAQFWDGCSEVMQLYTLEISGAQWTGEAGIFGSVTRPYNQVCREIARWCGQGQTQMQDIADALVTTTATYRDSESANTQLSSGIDV